MARPSTAHQTSRQYAMNHPNVAAFWYLGAYRGERATNARVLRDALATIRFVTRERAQARRGG